MICAVLKKKRKYTSFWVEIDVNLRCNLGRCCDEEGRAISVELEKINV